MRTLVVGAGAVGRGFVAPILAEGKIEIDFAERDNTILEALSGRTQYLTAVAGSDGYELCQVEYGRAMAPERVGDIRQYDAVFVSVGPNNYLACGTLLREARSVFVLENIRKSDQRLREVSGNLRIWFGIPDVIASNTAPAELLERDPLCVVAEKGELILQKVSDSPRFGDAVILADPQEFERHWICKFYIHNAPHAVAAFLGSLEKYTFIHEAMADDRIGPVVERSMHVICEAISVQGWVPQDETTAYMTRELKRFRNPLLFDPIERVARDPLRKLGRDDRLMQSLHVVTASGLDAYPIMLGVDAALICYGKTEGDSRRYADQHSAAKEKFLREICGLKDESTIRRLTRISIEKYLVH